MNAENFFTKAKTLPRPTVVDFWAPWCMPCRTTKPILEKLAHEYRGRVDFWAVNADEHPQLLKDLGILGIPTVMVLKDGKEVKRYMGAQTWDNYRRLFEALASGQAGTSLPVSPMDRFIRLGGGAALALIAVLTRTWWLLPLAGAVMFTGVYDRCPIWKAVTARFKR